MMLTATAVLLLPAVAAVFAAGIAIIVGWARHGRRPPRNQMRITMLHPDLGLGGAERLVIDAYFGLQSRGHSVTMVTNYHDPGRAFAETVDGRMRLKVVGAFLPRHIAGRGHVLLASLKMSIAAMYVALFAEPADCFIVDQVAAAMPVLRLFTGGAAIVFYCHFPDQLCDPNRAAVGGLAAPPTLIRRIARIPRYAYRFLFDRLEGWTMRAATQVVCNSRFSRSVTVATFPFLASGIQADKHVLYPPINLEDLLARGRVPPDGDVQALERELSGKRVLLSINRFERKKELTIAVAAFAALLKQAAAEKRPTEDLLLVMAGGYDPRLAENVEVHAGLVQLGQRLGIPDGQIRFLRSFRDVEKKALLRAAQVIVYTPSGEHFGIVPVEAMAFGKPVIAAESGGPLESITTSEEVGLLCKPGDSDSFSKAMHRLLYDSPNNRPSGDALRASMATAAQNRVERLFSLPAFAAALEDVVIHAVERTLGSTLCVRPT